MDSKAFIWACGRNTDGELALTDKTKSANLPRHVRQLADFTVKSFAASNNHTVMLTPLGEVHCAGLALHGKLGFEGLQKKSLPKFFLCS